MFIEAITKHFATATHRLDEDVSAEEWIKTGRPHCWILKEEHDNYQFWYDTAFGLLALYDGKHVEWSRSNVVVMHNYLGIRKEIYGLEYRLYKAVKR